MTTAKELKYPVLEWGMDWVFKGDKHEQSVQVDKSMLPKFQEEARAGELHLLDSGGRLFDVVDYVSVLPSNRFLKLLYVFTVPVNMVLANERQLELEEFKKYVRKAVNARQRYDRGSYILEDTMKKLPHARTYREAIESLPKVF